jgi:hypothetical protein
MVFSEENERWTNLPFTVSTIPTSKRLVAALELGIAGRSKRARIKAMLFLIFTAEK